MQIDPLRHIDLTPLAFAITGATLFWGVIRHQILDLIPIARDAIIESMHEAVFVLDLKNRVIDLNTAARQLIPSPRPIVGSSLSTLFPSLSGQMDQNQTSRSDNCELVLTANGVERVWRVRRSGLFSGAQTPSGWLITLQDITEKRHSEIALRESEEKFRSISANAMDGIVMIDPEGRVSFWNRAATQIFGYDEDEILGMELHAILAPESMRKSFHKAFAEFRRTGSGRAMGRVIEFECLRKNGDRFPAEISVSPLRLGGRWHAVGIVRDITERKKTQEFLIQTEKMLSVGGLAAGMAHEINNPLAGILSNVQVMRMRLLDDLPANHDAAAQCSLDLVCMRAYMEQRGIVEMIAAIEQSCERAAGIVRNMLDFSRKSDTVFAAHDLAGLLERTLALANNDIHLKSRHDFRQIEILREYAPDMPPVACDASQIQQVLLNILKNGAQAMWENEDRGRSPRFVIRLGANHAYGSITISDNGPGMPDDIRRRIFEPFYTTKPAGAGTGLGLSIAYFIVIEKHGGVLSVSSTPNAGTTFTVKLPLKQSR